MPNPRNRLKWNATCKVYPAIADLTAIEAIIQDHDSFVLTGTSYNYDSGVVPEGKIWVITAVHTNNTDASSNIRCMIVENGTEKVWFEARVGITTSVPIIWTGQLIVDEGQFIRIRVSSAAIGVTMTSDINGYQISKY